MDPVYCVNNGDNYVTLSTLFGYLIHSRICSNPRHAVAAHRLARELEAIRVVDETIQNRVGIRGIANLKVPTVLGDLRRHDG